MKYLCIGCAMAGKDSARSFRKKLFVRAEDPLDLAEKIRHFSGVPEADLSSFRKIGRRSRECVSAAMLAFADAGIQPDPRTFLLGGGTEGSYAENQLYFENYRSSIRHAGHGHLFVATLPTTPLCDAAMALKLHGGLFFVNGDRSALLNEAEKGPFPMLLVIPRKEFTVVFLLTACPSKQV